MIGTAISSTARARRDPGRQQAGRRVTFLAGPQHGQHGISATPAGVSSFFSHVVPDSAARARTIPLSQHLMSVTYGESPYPTTTTAAAAGGGGGGGGGPLVGRQSGRASWAAYCSSRSPSPARRSSGCASAAAHYSPTRTASSAARSYSHTSTTPTRARPSSTTTTTTTPSLERYSRGTPSPGAFSGKKPSPGPPHSPGTLQPQPQPQPQPQQLLLLQRAAARTPTTPGDRLFVVSPRSATPQPRRQRHQQTPVLTQQRPRTTSAAHFRCRRLGAEVYPTLQRRDLDWEKAFFRTGVHLINSIIRSTSRSQSAHWRAVAATPGASDSGLAESFCRSALAESRLNNAQLARMYHVVPQRVLSSRGGRDQAVSVALQQLNQTLCHRRTSFGRSIAISNPNNTISNSTTTNNNNNISDNDVASNPTTTTTTNNNNNNTSTNTNTSSNDVASNPNTTTTTTTNNNNNNTSTNNTSGNDTGKSINTNNSASSRANDVKNTSNVSLADPATKPADTSEPSEGKTTEGKTTEGKTTERRGRGPTDKPSARAALRGLMAVDVNEHSAEWLEESRLKQEESVAILSEQLKSMIVGSDLDHLSSSSNRLSPEDLGTSQEALSLELYRPEDLEEDKRGGEEGGGVEGGGGGGRGGGEGGGGGGGGSRERSLCMKTMQCEVLGPYSCSDCTKIRLNEHQQREQTALYPGLAVDPRTLVAPDRLKRLTASLPPHLTSQRYRLDCGCALQMHPDFLFPVIVTDHDIQSRLKSLRSAVPPARAGTPVRVDSSEGDSEAGSLFARGGGRGSVGDKMEREALSFGDDEAEEMSMSPTDMKVTVRYTTPSPEQKGVFITT